MTTYRGLDGFLSFGGRLEVTAGSILVNGALGNGAGSMAIDGTGLKGVLVVGDQFTLAGETGTPLHTVTGTQFRIAAGAAIAGITFTPNTASTVADNSVVNLVSNSVGEAKLWNVQSSQEMLDDSAMGDKWKTFVGGLAEWSGQGECWLDYGDTKQKALIDLIVAATPATTINGVLFGTLSGLKQWYGGAVLSGFSITGMELGAIAQARFDFQGSGTLLPNWA